jgi:hypothetical protein
LIKIFKFSIVLNIIIFIFTITIYGLVSALNLEVAFVSSSILIYLTYYSYKKSVEYKVSLYVVNDNRDSLDSIDDKFELYEEKEDDFKQQNIIKSKRVRIPIFLSLYRVVGYSILVVGFYFMIKYNILDGIFYIVGVSILPISSLFYLFTKS